MKSIVLSGVVASLLIFSGCGDKTPSVDEKPQVSKKQKPRKVRKSRNTHDVEEVQAVDTETVASEDSMVGSMSNSTSHSSSNEITLYDNEAKLASVYFDFDKFTVESNMREKISSDTTVLNGVASAYSIKLEGNCDEWGSDEYNFALGLKRANAVKEALISEGISKSRIVMFSYGESNPACNDKTDSCWAKNRRVDFELLP